MNGRHFASAHDRATAAESATALSSVERWVGQVLVSSAALMMPSYPDLPRRERDEVEAEMESFLIRQVFSMPRYLLVPVVAAILAFDLLPILSGGQVFCKLPKERQARINEQWANSRIAQKRDLMKLIRNCALYYYLDHPLVRAALDRAESEQNAG